MRFFCHFAAYNFGTFRAEANVTIRRHEVVYRLSSERKMIDLEWPLQSTCHFNAEIWDNAACFICPVLLTHILANFLGPCKYHKDDQRRL